MRKYGLQKVALLLDATLHQIDHAGKNQDPDSVHKLRVSIRRLQQALRVFRDFLPIEGAAVIKKRLKGILKLAAQVRERDIAVEMLATAGMPTESMDVDRQSASQELARALLSLKPDHLPRKWYKSLELHTS